MKRMKKRIKPVLLGLLFPVFFLSTGMAEQRGEIHASSDCVGFLRGAFSPDLEPKVVEAYRKVQDMDQELKVEAESSETPLLSIVIPSFNEERRLPGTIEAIKRFFDRFPFSLEILIIVEKSSDKTLDLARDLTEEDKRFKVVDNLVHRGKGYAVKSGILMARGKYVLFMDADLATPPSEVIQFLATFYDDPSADIVLGNRNLEGSVAHGQTALRSTMSRVFSGAVRLLSGISMSDTQFGLKAFRGEIAKSIFQLVETDGFAFDIEALLIAERFGFSFVERPVEWRNVAGSKVNPLRDATQMIKDVVVIRERLNDRGIGRAVGGTP